jgi:hypothetical protein
VEEGQGLPLTDVVGHCDARGLGEGSGEGVPEAQGDAVEEAEAQCDAE